VLRCEASLRAVPRTNYNPSGNLVGGWTAAPSLVTGRRSLGVASARLDDASRFLYAIGGEDAAGTALTSIEVAALDRFGKLGAWTKQSNELKVARSGHAVVRRGLYLYAIGGTSSVNGTRGADNTDPSGTPLTSIERAKLLEPSGAPTLDAATASTATGTLSKGTYYYRVAAVLDGSTPATEGETLPSEVVVVTLTATGQVQLSWTAPSVGSVASYRVYRTAAADGASGSEVLLETGVVGTTFTDTGSEMPGTEKPMNTGGYRAVGHVGHGAQPCPTQHLRHDRAGSQRRSLRVRRRRVGPVRRRSGCADELLRARADLE